MTLPALPTSSNCPCCQATWSTRRIVELTPPRRTDGFPTAFTTSDLASWAQCCRYCGFAGFPQFLERPLTEAARAEAKALPSTAYLAVSERMERVARLAGTPQQRATAWMFAAWAAGLECDHEAARFYYNHAGAAYREVADAYQVDLPVHAKASYLAGEAFRRGGKVRIAETWFVAVELNDDAPASLRALAARQRRNPTDIMEGECAL